MKALIDLSSLVKTHWLKGVDDLGTVFALPDGSAKVVNSVEYGLNKVVEALEKIMEEQYLAPFDLIFVREGAQAKNYRQLFDPRYKSNRTEPEPEVQAALAETHSEINRRFFKLMRNLGSTFVSQADMEADDVIAYLCSELDQPHMIITNDRDLAAIPDYNRRNIQTLKHIGGELRPKGYNPFGDFPSKYITLYKALVGDSADCISGIVGFGKAAWTKLWENYGRSAGADLLIDYLDKQESFAGLASDAEVDKFVAKIYAGFQEALRSWRCAKLHVDQVNTLYGVLDWEHGLNCLSEQEVYALGGLRLLASFAVVKRLATTDTFVSAKKHLFRNLHQNRSVSFDIETTTPVESDEWLQAISMASGKGGKALGIDVIGAKITGFSLTYGRNWKFSTYFSANHKDTKNIPLDQLGEFLLELQVRGVEFIIHNTNYEGPVCKRTWGDVWEQTLPDYRGLIANWTDTKLEASYVNENTRHGLKDLSKNYLGYTQVTYEQVTTKGGTTSVADSEEPAEDWLDAESLVTEGDDDYTADDEEGNTYQVKMDELTGIEVKDYGCDDGICAAALHEAFVLLMRLEQTLEVYRAVEIPASYQHALSFCTGFKIDTAMLNQLRIEDEELGVQAWERLRDYILKHHPTWPGCAFEPVTDLSPKEIKQAFFAYTGKNLESRDRKLTKLVEAVNSQGAPELGAAIAALDIEQVNNLLKLRHTPEPKLNLGSPKQKRELLYDYMGLTVQVRKFPTAKQKAVDKFALGSPSTDNLAIQYGLIEVGKDDPRNEALQAIQHLQTFSTRESLFYKPYPKFIHWATGRVHSSHNQCSTVTRRGSSSKPNIQQLSKTEKVEGLPPKIRNVILPHKRNALIVSMDFASQELRVIADYSKDPAMLDCFIGDVLKDMHALTGLGIFNSKNTEVQLDYDEFIKILHDTSHKLHKVVKNARILGKKTNFTTEYGAGAPKLAVTLLVSVEEAQLFIDAKLAAFPVAAAWKLDVIEEARRMGYVKTKLGARRHLRDALFGSKSEASKAERQAVNFKIQGSSAEMTKLAEGRMWNAKLDKRFDCVIIGPIHDEVVASVSVTDLFEFCKAMHACMVDRYAGMQVPIESSISFGPNFGLQIEVGNYPTLEAIKSGLTALKNKHGYSTYLEIFENAIQQTTPCN